MDRTEKLKSLQWNDFEKYPPQLSNIYIHSVAVDEKGEQIHKILRICCFNAVTFKIKQLEEKLGNNLTWQHYWLPASFVDGLL